MTYRVACRRLITIVGVVDTVVVVKKCRISRIADLNVCFKAVCVIDVWTKMDENGQKWTKMRGFRELGGKFFPIEQYHTRHTHVSNGIYCRVQKVI